MIKILTNLLKIKSLMTISVMIVFMVLSLNGRFSDENIMIIITSVITYYFTKQGVE